MPLIALALTLAAAPSALRTTGEAAIPPVAPQSTAAPTAPLRDPRLPLAPLVPGAASAAGAISTLGEAIALAAKSNPKLLAQRATLRASDHGVAAARGAYGPTLDITASAGYTADRNDSVIGITLRNEGWANSAAAVLTQPLHTFGRTASSVAAAQAQVGYNREALRIQENQVLLAVVTDYVNVLRDAIAVTLARQNLGILEKQHRDDAARAQVHEITVADLHQVETRLQNARGALEAAMGQLGVSQAQFLRDVGAPAGELAPPDLLSLPVQTIEDAYAVADSESPVVRAAQQREKASRAESDAAKAAFMPRVDFKGTASVGTTTPYTDLYRTRRLQGEFVMSLPLLDGGQRIAKLGEARETNEADWRLIEAASRETRASVASAWEQLAAARASLGFYRDATKAAREAFEGAQLQHLAGDRTTFDVLDLARDLLLVQTNFNTALANEYLARANLMAAMGQLEAPNLLRGDAPKPYDPAAHYRRVATALDFPQGPVLLALDGLIIGGEKPLDRPNQDPAARIAQQAKAPLLPEKIVLPIATSIFLIE